VRDRGRRVELIGDAHEGGRLDQRHQPDPQVGPFRDNIFYQRCGTLRIATSERQAETQRKRLPKQQALGLNLRWVSAEEARELEPSLTPDIVGAIYGPDEGLLDATRLHKALMLSAKAMGVSFERGTVTGLKVAGTRIVGVEMDTRYIETGHVVIATGAWAPDLNAWLGVDIPITPERGQILSLSHTPRALSRIVFGEQIYLAPQWGRRQALVGASKDQSGYEVRTTVAGVSMLLDKCVKIAPTFATATMERARAGLRPRTPDGCPIIGPVEGFSGLSLAVGHNSNGLLLSAITGQIIAAQLNGNRTPIDATPYQLSRFTPSDE
jgi:glycine oxidase